MFNEKKFRVIYDEYLGSGLTIRDFCANQQMNEAKFYYWQNKLKAKLPPKSGFVPMVFENEKHFLSNRIPGQKNQEVMHPAFSCEISCPNGVSVKLNGLSDPQMLQSLLDLIRQ